MTIAETEIHNDVSVAPPSAADLAEIVLPIGFTQEKLKERQENTPNAETLRMDAALLADAFTDTMSALLNLPPDQITNHFIELTGEVPLQGHPEGYPTKRETVQLGAVHTYKINTTEPDGMQYIMRRITSVNGSQAEELTRVSIPDQGDPYISLSRISKNHGKQDGADIYYPNTRSTINGATQMVSDIQQAVEKGDAGLNLARVTPIRVNTPEAEIHPGVAAQRAASDAGKNRAAVRQMGGLVFSVFEATPRGGATYTGPDGTAEITTWTNGNLQDSTYVQIVHRTSRGHEWAGLNVPYANSRRPSEVAFQKSGLPSQEARLAQIPFPGSGLVVNFGTNTPDSIHGAMILTRNIVNGIRSGAYKRISR